MTAAPNTIQVPPSSSQQKLGGHEWWQAIGEPKYVVAPMVDQSELAWRVLSRVHGATLAYTPMFHAALFSSSPKYFEEQFDTSPESIEGVAPYDRPLVVQFCANDKDKWLEAAKKVEGRCDAVDLNLGCPQGIAKKGHYGAFLMDEWDLIRSMISHLHEHLATPVIAKLRVFPTLDRTLDYASHIFSSGAQLVTIHGRTREAKGRLAGFASWPKIRAVTELLGSRVPVLANGGVPSAEEVEPCLAETGAKGIMSAEGNLYNPMIFSPSNAAGGRSYLAQLPVEMREAILACDVELVGEWDRDRPAYAPSTYLASQYLAIVRTLPHTKTATSAIKAHLFKLFRPTWAEGRHLDLREMLGKAGGGRNSKYGDRVQGYQDFVDEFRRRFKADIAEDHLPPNALRPLTLAEIQSGFGGVIPYSHAQPYLRVAQPEADEVVAGTATSAEKENENIMEETNGKRAASPSAGPASDPKRLKPSTDDSTKDATAVPPMIKDKTIPCVNSTRTEAPCINSCSVKCSHSACLACCVATSKADPGVGGCEHHEDKQRKEQEKKQRKKQKKRDGGASASSEAKVVTRPEQH